MSCCMFTAGLMLSLQIAAAWWRGDKDKMEEIRPQPGES